MQVVDRYTVSFEPEPPPDLCFFYFFYLLARLFFCTHVVSNRFPT